MTNRDPVAAARADMVTQQIARRGVSDIRVLVAMGTVPRHEFVPASQIREAYGDHPLPIGDGQTISQPYIVAYMTEALNLQPGARVLEVGTGCGYQTAVLLETGAAVFSLEVIPMLLGGAVATLERLGYVADCRVGDGYEGWPENAPYDGVIATAAPPEIPSALVDQLGEGGRLVIPVGVHFQELKVLEKREGDLKEISTLGVRFVPMVRG